MSHWTQASAADLHTIFRWIFLLSWKANRAIWNFAQRVGWQDECNAERCFTNSQFSSGEPKVETLVHYARNLGLKVAVVAYDDNDPEMIAAYLFRRFRGVVEESKSPQDLFDVQEACRHEPSISQVPLTHGTEMRMVLLVQRLAVSCSRRHARCHFLQLYAIPLLERH